MELIRGIHENEFGKMEGEVYFGYIKEYIGLSFKKNVPIEYVEKTAELLNELSEEKINEICTYSMAYYKDTLECYPDIAEDIDMENVNSATDILKHMEFGMLVVNLSEDMNQVGLNLEGSCEWAEDDGIQWIIKNDKIVYVGPWHFQNMWRAKYEDDLWNFAGVNEER